MYHHRTSYFAFNAPATSRTNSLSLHDALPILWQKLRCSSSVAASPAQPLLSGWRAIPIAKSPSLPARLTRTNQTRVTRSEEHTSELQSPCNLVCRLLLEKKQKKKIQIKNIYTQ